MERLLHCVASKKHVYAGPAILYDDTPRGAGDGTIYSPKTSSASASGPFGDLSQWIGRADARRQDTAREISKRRNLGFLIACVPGPLDALVL